MNIGQAKELIEEFLKLPRFPDPEPTMLSVGGRGYYENPTTDLLAFFLNSDASHGFNEVIMQAFFDCLSVDRSPQSLRLANPPLRELKVDGGRIDLLLEGDDWVLVIENKIFHDMENPFDKYRDHVEMQFSNKRRKYFVVLSPGGGSPEKYEGWNGIDYATLIDSFKKAIGSIFVDHSPGKWIFFFRDFVINLENVMKTNNVPDEAIEFFLENLSNLDEVVKEKNKAMECLQVELHARLADIFSGRELIYKLETWHGFPALRFHFHGMGEKSTVVLFLDGRSGEGFGVYFYVCDIQNESQRADADQAMRSFSDIGRPWNEQKGAIRGYCRYLPDSQVSTMTKMLAEALERLDYFERVVRPSWCIPPAG